MQELASASCIQSLIFTLEDLTFLKVSTSISTVAMYSFFIRIASNAVNIILKHLKDLALIFGLAYLVM